jgi:hypothetical protein
MQPTISDTSANKPRKKGSGTNRPAKIKDITKVRTNISIDPTVLQKAKQKLGRKLSSKIEDFLRILIKE